MRHREAKNYFQVFYARRALRIFPLYYFLLAVYFIIHFTTSLGSSQSFQPGKVALWTYPLLIQNFPMAFTGEWGVLVLGITWTVALEEQFYIFLPPLIRFVTPRGLPMLIAILAATGPLFRYLAPVAHAPFLFPGSIESLFGGVLIAWFHRKHLRFFQSPHCVIAAVSIFGVSAAGMFLLAAKRHFGPFEGTIITLFWASFLWLVLAKLQTSWTRVFRLRWLREIGRISYGVYLFHAITYAILLAPINGGKPARELGPAGALLALAAFVITLLFATTSFRLVEQRLIRLGQCFAYRN
jgi:peptidoglycan/LPS O-acetylase OafA/YrhL